LTYWGTIGWQTHRSNASLGTTARGSKCHELFGLCAESMCARQHGCSTPNSPCEQSQTLVFGVLQLAQNALVLERLSLLLALWVLSHRPPPQTAHLPLVRGGVPALARGCGAFAATGTGVAAHRPRGLENFRSASSRSANNRKNATYGSCPFTARYTIHAFTVASFRKWIMTVTTQRVDFRYGERRAVNRFV
jgi:hypothetical protein